MPRRRNAPNQTRLVHEHLIKHGSITESEARARYQCITLKVIITRLRRKGVYIKNRWKKDCTGRIYVRYDHLIPINIGKGEVQNFILPPVKYRPKHL